MDSEGVKAKQQIDPMAQIVLGAGLTVAFHPITYTKTLIQLGFEPLAPVPTTTIWGKKALVYPNVIKYLKHIKQTDGFLGLYRGVGPRIIGGMVTSLTNQAVSKKLKELDGERPHDEDVAEGSLQDFQNMCRDTCIETASRFSGIIVSQPFILIMTRSMAQFVGKETKYNSIFSSICTVYKEEGILGFFNGMLARLASELITIWLVNLLVYSADRYLLQGNKNLSTYNNAACTMLVSQLVYPFQLVATLMAVNTSGLEAGSAPHMPSYSSWTHCFCSLTRQNQLKRGSSLIWRYYSGPTVTSASGQLMAAKQSYQ